MSRERSPSECRGEAKGTTQHYNHVNASQSHQGWLNLQKVDQLFGCSAGWLFVETVPAGLGFRHTTSKRLLCPTSTEASIRPGNSRFEKAKYTEGRAIQARLRTTDTLSTRDSFKASRFLLFPSLRQHLQDKQTQTDSVE
ncbi:unnamed protein product [Protopolystoma xenopodis]|uniref:Uncharacterized protein n=1 Tax=Protopolystoma xenopodis TaxID=117903 RepID=A0A3S5FDD3_9PLAT|nr:unnamed protein product [Protopolystoma xenopodis]